MPKELLTEPDQLKSWLEAHGRKLWDRKPTDIVVKISEPRWELGFND